MKGYVPSGYETIVSYSREFELKGMPGAGWTFPCDENGDLLPQLSECAVENYRKCLETPEKFSDFNRIRKSVRTYRTNPHGICECGEHIELYNEYMGACECPRCGRWYNLFGQELMPPKNWEDVEYDY